MHGCKVAVVVAVVVAVAVVGDGGGCVALS